MLPLKPTYNRKHDPFLKNIYFEWDFSWQKKPTETAESVSYTGFLADRKEKLPFY